MELKEMSFYPEILIDALVFVGVGVALVLLSKCLWDWKEERRLKKEMAEYHQRRADEAADE